MYRLVITILFSTFVIFLGLVASAAFLHLIFQPQGLLYSIVPFGVAILFFYMGMRSFTVAVRFLLGKAPGDHWERWIFSVSTTWM